MHARPTSSRQITCAWSTIVARAALIFSAAFVAPGLAAQAPPEWVPPSTAWVNVGLTSWELGGGGTSSMVAVRADRQLGWPALLTEGSVGLYRAHMQTGGSNYLVTEVQLQLQRPSAFAPYVGVGGGVLRSNGEHSATGSLAVGLRLWQVLPTAVLRTELRVRGHGRAFVASEAEWTIGLGWAL